MVTVVVTELEGFKAKLQQAIDHVKAGVTHLNEDQRAEAMVKLADLEEHLEKSLDKCFEVLRPPAEQLVPEPLKSHVDGPEVVELPSDWTQHDSAGHEVHVHVGGTGIPTAEDLDTAAAEQKAKDETTKPIWGAESVAQQ